MTDRTLSGLTALITGAARRIGRAIALELAQAGANIVLHARASVAEARELAREIEALGRRTLVVVADQRDVEAVRRACEDAIERFGRVDILVNSAAVWPSVKLDACTQEDFDLALETNLRGPFFWARYLGVHMKRNGSGAIVTLGDAGTDRTPPDTIPYAIAKSGLTAMTLGLAKALAPEVRVNAIGPGPVLFPTAYPEEAKHAARAATLLGREGRPEDIARAVLFLLESPYITGVCLPVDGGYRLGASERPSA